PATVQDEVRSVEALETDSRSFALDPVRRVGGVSFHVCPGIGRGFPVAGVLDEVHVRGDGVLLLLVVLLLGCDTATPVGSTTPVLSAGAAIYAVGVGLGDAAERGERAPSFQTADAVATARLCAFATLLCAGPSCLARQVKIASLALSCVES